MLCVLKQQQTKVASQMKSYGLEATKKQQKNKDLCAESSSHHLHDHTLLYAQPHSFLLHVLHLRGFADPHHY
jgi:hypothetical protein